MPVSQEDLKKKIETLKKQVGETKKAKTKANAKSRAEHKSLKRAQRRLRQATGKKLATIQKKHAKE